MSNILYYFLAAICGYLLGSINNSLVVGKFYGVDVRKHGSGNAGTTNTLRTLGGKAALLVLVGDILKAIIACFIGSFLGGLTSVMIGGAFAIIGHNWPLYFGFKGGKGVLTAISVIFYIDWILAVIVLGAFIVVVAITRYVSLGSVIGAAILPVLAIIFRRDMEFIIFTVALAALVIIKHMPNIKRLLNGTESKLGKKVSH
ncbi:MAG TPA: glycerol-3-phosphate 1-O-acyltransferase PlsY [Clostridiales bacterium]|nr:glycerol-3-phosphate 1-O-acyltransferase PlsY [Clostridiales bacterium]